MVVLRAVVSVKVRKQGSGMHCTKNDASAAA
jgi:hypothetical protein